MPLVEKRYAQALLELSEKDTGNVRQEFEELVGFYNTLSEFKGFLLDPRIKADSKQALIKNVFSNRLDRNMLNFVLLLVAKQRISLLPKIFEQFVHLMEQRANVLEMKIITVQPLDEGQLSSIKDKFRKIYNASAVKAIEMLDESVIGGIKVIIGDKVYDGTIKGRIESLTELVNK